MKIKRFLKKLLKNIFSLLLWEIPIVLLFLMIYPKSPDKAIEMQVPGYAIILYDPPYVYKSNHGKKFLINGEEYTATTNYKPRNIYKLFDMLRKEDTVKNKYFWIGGGKCIVDIRSDSTVYSNYDKQYSTGKNCCVRFLRISSAGIWYSTIRDSAAHILTLSRLKGR